jgi:hypothetical protein
MEELAVSMSYPSPGQRAGCVEHPRQFALLQETAALEADCIYLSVDSYQVLYQGPDQMLNY